MSTGTATPEVVEEVVEEVTENGSAGTETKKKGRKAGKKLFNHDKVYLTKAQAEENEPYYSNEVTKKEGDKEVTTYEGKEEVEGFRIYKVYKPETKDGKDVETDLVFCWARNGDGALACFASQTLIAEPADPGERGRARKIDPIYVMFFKSLIVQGQVNDLVATLKAQELTHYLKNDDIVATLKAKGIDVETLAV